MKDNRGVLIISQANIWATNELVILLHQWSVQLNKRADISTKLPTIVYAKCILFNARQEAHSYWKFVDSLSIWFTKLILLRLLPRMYVWFNYFWSFCWSISQFAIFFHLWLYMTNSTITFIDLHLYNWILFIHSLLEWNVTIKFTRLQ